MSATAKKTYAERVADLAQQIADKADHLKRLEAELARWKKPEGKTFQIGSNHYHITRSDGTVTPELAGVQREAIAVHERQIFLAKSKLEGLRWKLVQLGKEGGAA